MRWLVLTLAVVAAAWLAHAAFRFLAWPFPGTGILISAPMDGALHFEGGNLKTISGGIRAVDFSPWWLPSIAASIVLLLGLAVRGCLVSRAPSR